ncbi:MAG: response regulator transcription factor [Bacteroidetes bacterium]|nr:response regulator transcription factor [Bacteroidota bacterium]
MKKIKLALVDDHKIVRDGIASLLMYEDKVEVVAEASNAEELLEILKNMEIDIIILDIFLPKPVGIELTKIIVKQFPKTKVIILSGNIEEDIVSGAFNAGADGYLPKDTEKEELLEAIYSVHDFNEQYLSNSIKNNLSASFIKKAKYGDKYSQSKLASLTEKEINIIKLFSEGLSYKEIANKLEISTRTVEAHKNNILEKLELRTIIDIVKYAIKNKIIEL